MKNIAIYLIILTGSLLVGLGFNMFLIPHQLLSGGASGVAMVIGYYTHWNIAPIYFLINLPLLFWGLLIIGKRFIALSIISVLCTTGFMEIFPLQSITQDPLLAAVFGGVLVGIGAGIILRAGGSTGGFDIVGSILTRKWDFPLGTLIFALNGLVVLILGELKNWDLALSSMLSIYISGKVVDMIHIRHIKITAFIVTNETSNMLEKMLKLSRGVTVIRTRGAFSYVEKDMLMTVTTRYELAELRRIIQEVDPRAFVNIVETVAVLGEFRKTK